MVNVAKLVRKKLGEILVEEGLVTAGQVEEALRRQQETGELVGEALIQLRHVSEVDIARTIAHQFGLPFLHAENYVVARAAFEMVPVETMVQNQFIVLDRIGKTLVVAVSGVLHSEIFESLEASSGCRLFIYVSTGSSVMAALRKWAPKAAAAKE